MRPRSLFILAPAGLCAAGAAALLARREDEPRVSLHPDDLPGEGELVSRRTWRGPGHLAHHLRELLTLTPPLGAVYLKRAIDPAFRERIMLVTALANECSW